MCRFKKNSVCRAAPQSCGYTGTAICRKNAWDLSFCAKQAKCRRWKRSRLIFRNVKSWSMPRAVRPETGPFSTYRNMCSRIFSHRPISPVSPSLRTARLRRLHMGKHPPCRIVRARMRIWWCPRTAAKRGASEALLPARPKCRSAAAAMAVKCRLRKQQTGICSVRCVPI